MSQFKHSNLKQGYGTRLTTETAISMPVRNETAILTDAEGRKSAIVVEKFDFERVVVPIFDSTALTLAVGIANNGATPTMINVTFPVRFYYDFDNVLDRIQIALNAEAASNSVDPPIVSFVYESVNEARLRFDFPSGFLAAKDLVLNQGFADYFPTLRLSGTGVVIPTAPDVAEQKISKIKLLNPCKRFILRSSGLPVRGEFTAFNPSVGYADSAEPYLADYIFPPLAYGYDDPVYVSGPDSEARYHNLLGEVRSYDLSASIELNTGETIPGVMARLGLGAIDIAYVTAYDKEM